MRKLLSTSRARAVAFVAAIWLQIPPLVRADTADAAWFRVFLTDGTAAVSYGEYARVGDRIVFSMPVGIVAGEARLHLVSLPARAVDWPATERYADATRFARYTATRGEADFARLSAEVARALNDIALTNNPAQRVQSAERARRALAEWPATHYGYRAADVREILGLLDEAVSELRAAAGLSRFELNLVAAVEPPPPPPLLRNPTPAESIQQALAVARLADVPAERLSLLRAVVAEIDEMSALLPGSWARARKAAVDAIEAEVDVERVYLELANAMLSTASARVAWADVRGVENVLRETRRRDEKLGRRRSDRIAALVGALEAQLDVARRLRLARDQWALRAHALRAYRDAVGDTVRALARERARLEDIKALAGPDAAGLARLGARVASVLRDLARIIPPSELDPAHTMLTTAAQLADNAVRTRRQAMASGDLQTAWDASSAAAGSLMLLARARVDMERGVKRPELR